MAGNTQLSSQPSSGKTHKRESLVQNRDRGKHGVYTREAESEEELGAFYKQLRSYFRFKTRRSIPHRKMFSMLNSEGDSKTFVTIYKTR